MNIYNIYFSIKEGCSESQVLKLASELTESIQRIGLISGAKLSRVADKGNFCEMPDFHLEFKNEVQMNESFDFIRRELMHKHPHSLLMKSVGAFEVTFSESVD